MSRIHGLNIEQYSDESNTALIEKYMPKFSVSSFTFKITIVQIVFFLLSVILGTDGVSPSICSLLLLGAKYTPLIVEKGQIWRLLLPILLHGSIMHIASNLFFQLRFGFAIEDYYGTKRYLLIYLVSGIGGNLMSAFEKTENVSIGASTSIFGLLAVLACYYAYNWHKLGVGRNFNLFIYACFVIVSFVVSVNSPSIDLYGHLGGYVVGVLIGILLLPREENNRLWTIYKIGSGLALGAYFTIFILSLAKLSFDCKQSQYGGNCNPCDGLMFK